jgi:uncharacterized protein
MRPSLTYEEDGKLYLGGLPVGSFCFDRDGRLHLGGKVPRPPRLLATDEAPHFDADGRLHLAVMPLSRAAVEPYPGETLAYAGNVTGGTVDPDKVYSVFRPPSELHRAAHTFRHVPITAKHFLSPLEPIPPDAIVGTVGDRVAFDDPILAGDAVIWTQGALDGLAGGFRSAPSVGFVFDLELREGTFRGQPFNAVFRNIHGHHVALCPRGRSDLEITPRARK